MHDATSVGVIQKQRDSSVKCIPCSSVQCEHAMLVRQWPLDDHDIPELLVDFLEQDVSTGYSIGTVWYLQYPGRKYLLTFRAACVAHFFSDRKPSFPK